MRFRSLKFLAACLVVYPLMSASAADIPRDLMVDLDSLTVSKSEFICLALNDYFEARGESLAGRLAVTTVVLNRAMDPRFPANLCSVIKQNKNRALLHRCQFSWTCDGRSDTPHNNIAWHRSLKLAAAVLQKDSSLVDPTGGALWVSQRVCAPGLGRPAGGLRHRRRPYLLPGYGTCKRGPWSRMA